MVVLPAILIQAIAGEDTCRWVARYPLWENQGESTLMPVLVRSVLWDDVDDFGAQLSNWTVRPLQLTSGALRVGFSTLAFEDLAVSRLDCNQQLADHLCMDPSWLLIVVQLTPQRWNSCEAPPSSVAVIAPGSDYRSMIFKDFRCVEVAVRVDLAEAIGLGSLCRLTGAEAIHPLPPGTTRIAERRVTQLLDPTQTNVLLGMSDDAEQAVRERCVELLRYLSAAISLARQVQDGLEARLRTQRFDLVQAALRLIDAAPPHEQPSVTDLARVLGTTRRTLLNAFVDALGTTPSRYILARRLHSARQVLRNGRSPSVTVAALDQGFEHLGRFSQHYQTLFGELPSRTLQRSHRLRMGDSTASAPAALERLG
ncbi:AraC family transcriptional regulator [Thiorhodococcus minor]|nr:helix-turn-helix domain-containing protein [Thiorhodococcus minor]